MVAFPHTGESHMPDKNVTDHCGNALPSNLDFFAPPPPEIGEVTSAFSSLQQQGQQPVSLARRLGHFLVGGTVFAIVGWAINYFADVQDTKWFIVWQFGLPALVAALGWLGDAFSHTCSYVGKKGVAEFTCTGSRDQVKRTCLLEWRDAAEVRNEKVRVSVNFSYLRTNYSFTWTDAAGAERLKIAGAFYEKKGDPPNGDRYHFGVAAERSWSTHLLGRLQGEWDTGRSIRFNLERGNYVAIGHGFMDFCFSGNLEHCHSNDIVKVSIATGLFKVELNKPRPTQFGSILSFPCASIANFHVFLFSLEKLAGFCFK
jgi:hypothetical protein